MSIQSVLKRSVLFSLLFSLALAKAQVQTFYVEPFQVDTSYALNQDSSTIKLDASTQLNKLFLFIGGSGSSSSTAYIQLGNTAVDLGFNFINLSYINDVSAYSVSNDPDSLVFDKYREELCFGTPVSDHVTVDSFNAIYTRTLSLLQYLDANYPAANWNEFLLNANTLDWSKIVIGGHSQGAGHAAYLAKQFAVDRVLMFSGPNDYSNASNQPANWFEQSSATAVNRHFSYLSLNDEAVDYSKQFENISALGLLNDDDSTYVDNIQTPYQNSNVLYTTQSPGLVIFNHSVPVKFTVINKEVWTYMLTTPIVTGIKSDLKENSFSVYPNPGTSLVRVRADKVYAGKKYNLYDSKGKNILTGEIKENSTTLDIEDLAAGFYFLRVESHTLKLLKK